MKFHIKLDNKQFIEHRLKTLFALLVDFILISVL